MLLVGLTGGIASGKSSVARIFQELGVDLVDADRVSRDVVEPGSPAWEEITAAFGEEVLLPDGKVDRARLGDVVFADEARRRELEAIVHPRIAAEIDRRLEELGRAHPDGIIMVDAALMIEVGRWRHFDRLVVVWAEEETQTQRLMARDGLSRAEAHRRVGAQMPLTEKINFADFVIDNNGTPEKTRAAVERVFGELRRLAAAKS